MRKPLIEASITDLKNAGMSDDAIILHIARMGDGPTKESLIAKVLAVLPPDKREKVEYTMRHLTAHEEVTG